MRRLTLRFVFASTVPFIFGCGPPANYALLECRWKEEDKPKESSYCFNANGTACKGYEPSAQEWCAWNQFHSQAPADINKFSNPDGFAKITWQKESCLGDGGHQQSKFYPPDPNNPGATCNDQSIISGGGASSPSATAGTTGGGEPTTTAGAGGTIYVCSMLSPWKCADLDPDAALADLAPYPDPYTKPDDPLHAKWDACWSAVAADESLYLSKCVDAPSELAARTGCQDLCNDWRMAMEMACAKDVDCKVVTTVDCALDGTYINNMGKEVVGDLPGEQPVKQAELPNYACDGEPVKVGEGA